LLEFLDRNYDDGWYQGELVSSGEKGIFPSSYVEAMT